MLHVFAGLGLVKDKETWPCQDEHKVVISRVLYEVGEKQPATFTFEYETNCASRILLTTLTVPTLYISSSQLFTLA